MNCCAGSMPYALLDRQLLCSVAKYRQNRGSGLNRERALFVFPSKLRRFLLLHASRAVVTLPPIVHKRVAPLVLCVSCMLGAHRICPRRALRRRSVIVGRCICSGADRRRRHASRGMRCRPPHPLACVASKLIKRLSGALLAWQARVPYVKYRLAGIRLKPRKAMVSPLPCSRSRGANRDVINHINSIQSSGAYRLLFVAVGVGISW